MDKLIDGTLIGGYDGIGNRIRLNSEFQTVTAAIAELVNDRRYPFVIVMTNGDRYMVEHSLQISANAEYAHWTPEKGPGKFLSVLQIHYIEPPGTFSDAQNE